MHMLTILFWLCLPLLFILGLSATAGWFMGDIWAEFQDVPRRNPIWLFRGIASLGSMSGLVFGYYLGYHHPTQNCGLSAIGCGLQVLVNGIQSGIAGACLGAIFCVIGLAYFLQLQKLCQRY